MYPNPRNQNEPALGYWYFVSVIRQPVIKRLEPGIQRTRRVYFSWSAEIIAEVAVKLKHVAQIVSPGEVEPAVYLGRHRRIADFLVQRARHRIGHLLP